MIVVQKIFGLNPIRYLIKIWRVNLDSDMNNLLSCFVPKSYTFKVESSSLALPTNMDG